MENTNGTNVSKQAKKKWSEGYRILTRFFKEIGLYKEFKIYQQQTGKLWVRIPETSEDILEDYAKSNISHFIRVKFNKFPKYHILETLVHFVKEFYPNHFESSHYSRKGLFLRGNRHYPINKEQMVIRTEFNHCYH